MTFPPADRRAAAVSAAAFLFVAALPSAARGLEASIEGVEADSAGLSVEVRLPDLYSSRLKERLEQGLPSTLIFELELYRNRRHWFDSRVARYVYLVKLSYDPWTRVYSLRSPADLREESDTASVRRFIEEHALTVPWIPEPDTTRTYFFSVRATLKLLTADDIREVEEWLGGHMKHRSLLDLPVGLLGVLKEASGLGDESASAKGGRFLIGKSGAVQRL